MIIKFNEIKEKVMPEFKGGIKNMTAKMYVDNLNKIMKGCLEPGASIGLHTHDNGCEVVFIISGKGKVLYDGEYITLNVGDCHYCPKGHEHSLINDSNNEDLIFYAVVAQQ